MTDTELIEQWLEDNKPTQCPAHGTDKPEPWEAELLSTEATNLNIPQNIIVATTEYD